MRTGNTNLGVDEDCSFEVEDLRFECLGDLGINETRSS